MNTRKLIISLMRLNLLGKIGFASMWGKCNKDLEKIISTFFHRHTYCQMSFQSFKSSSNLIKHNNQMTKMPPKISGSSSQLQVLKEKAYL